MEERGRKIVVCCLVKKRRRNADMGTAVFLGHFRDMCAKRDWAMWLVHFTWVGILASFCMIGFVILR